MADCIRAGNIKLVFCFAFYLAWWIVGFNPKFPVRGMKSGWLLIPAFILGAWALADIVSGLELEGGPLSGIALIVGGVVTYVVLLVISAGPLHRLPTSELFIIVLWTTVILLEINTLVALGTVAGARGWILMALCLVCATASLVCYLLFYGLDTTRAFIVGAIPLVLACVMTGVVALFAA